MGVSPACMLSLEREMAIERQRWKFYRHYPKATTWCYGNHLKWEEGKEGSVWLPLEGEGASTLASGLSPPRRKDLLRLF